MPDDPRVAAVAGQRQRVLQAQRAEHARTDSQRDDLGSADEAHAGEHACSGHGGGGVGARIVTGKLRIGHRGACLRVDVLVKRRPVVVIPGAREALGQRLAGLDAAAERLGDDDRRGAHRDQRRQPR